jgi:hypothetical protein
MDSVDGIPSKIDHAADMHLWTSQALHSALKLQGWVRGITPLGRL